MLTTTVWRSRRKLFGYVAVFFAACFVFLGSAGSAYAQVDLQTGASTVAESAQLQDQPLTEIIGNIINGVLATLGVIALIIIIYAGFLWMTAGGNAEQVEKAKKWLINGFIGLLIILAAYAIVTFIINLLEQAFYGSSSTDEEIELNGDVSVPPFSNSLGSGELEDHYPRRGATNVDRGTSISVTFKNEMVLADFITDCGGGTMGLNTDYIEIAPTDSGFGPALTCEQVSVADAEGLTTFVFYPPILGSATDEVNYTVTLSDQLENAEGVQAIDPGGYSWTFEVGTQLDIEPPTVESVRPVEGSENGRNIVVQINFSEAVDPVSATGSTTEDGFTNIRLLSSSGQLIDGQYTISNEYRTVTFTSDKPCGTNSCGDTIYCLPANNTITGVVVTPPVLGANPPRVDVMPFGGVVDMSRNAFDGDADGTAGPDYSWNFSTNNNIVLDGPNITAITPDIQASNVDLDQPIIITFDSVMMMSTINTENIAIDSRVMETGSSPAHELAYSLSSHDIYAPALDDYYTETTVRHGVLLDSTAGLTYEYRVSLGEGLRNEYQNCYDPARGPDAQGGVCATSQSEPWCCNGRAESSPCSEF